MFSRTLTEVGPNARLARDDLATEVERLRRGGDGLIAIGGGTLAAQAAALGLVDEYRLKVHPVVVGGGIPYFPHRQQRHDLTLVAYRVLDSGVVLLRYGVRR